MAAATPFLRPAEARSFAPALAMAGLVVFAAMWGIALAVGELDALYLCLAMIGCLAVLFDFRVGALLLILLLPIGGTTLFPHSIMGFTGLNPMNLLVAATLVSFLLRARENNLARFVPPRLVWLYLAPIAIAGLLGAQQADRIPHDFYLTMAVNFTDAAGYLRDMLMKPLVMVLIALLIGAAVAKSQKPERFLIPIIASVWIMALAAIGYVIGSGTSIGSLARSDSRAFFSALGMHANDLGRLYAVAYALLLFTWVEAKSASLKLVLLMTMGTLVLALLLTFSRGAFLGFVVVNLLFLLWKFNAKTIALALLAVALAAFFLPGAVYERVMLGFDGGGDANAVSAGRIDGIWLPLVPELFRSPIWGNGLGSVMWSDAMLNGMMLAVTHPHSAYLEALLDMGLVGLGLLGAYFVHVWNGLRNLGSNAYLSAELRGFYQGAAAGLVSFAVTGVAGSSLTPRPEYAFLWIAIGMMYGQLSRRPAG